MTELTEDGFETMIQCEVPPEPEEADSNVFLWTMLIIIMVIVLVRTLVKYCCPPDDAESIARAQREEKNKERIEKEKADKANETAEMA